MRILQLTIASIILFWAQTIYGFDEINQDNSGAQLYKTYCEVCHGTTGGMDMNKRLAPPVMAIRMHYGNKLATKNEFVNAIVDWLEKPTESKSLMRGAIKRFNLMPLIPVAKDDAINIAEYIYQGNLDSPEGLKEHMDERHGKGGMGQGMKKGMGKGMGHGKMKDKDPETDEQQ